MGQLSKSGSARAAGRTELGFPLLLSPGAPSLFGLFRSHGLPVLRTFPVLTLCRRMWYRDLQYAFSKSAADCIAQENRLRCVSIILFIHIMRTNIVIDDKLMNDALRITGLKTKREAVELGLRTLLRLRQQEQIRRFRGKLKWRGDLDTMRTDR
jgi:Arc/MetJ family transcription regulator